jgi:hypothetical protein
MVVAGKDEVDAMPVEQRRPVVPHTAVGAVAVRGAEPAMVHRHDQKADGRVLAVPGEDVVKPAGLLAAGVTTVGRDLVADVVAVDLHEGGSPRAEVMRRWARSGSVVGTDEAGEVPVVALWSLAGLHLVVADGVHPRDLGGDPVDHPQPLVPDAGVDLVVGVPGSTGIGVAEVAGDEVEGRADRLDLPEDGPRGVGGALVAESGEGVGPRLLRERGEAAVAPAAAVEFDGVAVGGARPQFGNGHLAVAGADAGDTVHLHVDRALESAVDEAHEQPGALHATRE